LVFPNFLSKELNINMLNFKSMKNKIFISRALAFTLSVFLLSLLTFVFLARANRPIAVLSLIFALFILPLGGLIFGIIELVKIKKTGSEGKRQAIASIIYNAIILVLVLVIIIILFMTAPPVIQTQTCSALVGTCEPVDNCQTVNGDIVLIQDAKTNPGKSRVVKAGCLLSEVCCRKNAFS
jgi:hypothetical protein